KSHSHSQSRPLKPFAISDAWANAPVRNRPGSILLPRSQNLCLPRFTHTMQTHTIEPPTPKTFMNKTDPAPLPEAFAALGVRNSVLRGLAAAKFQTPSEIQSLLIPRALAGVDLLGQA